MKNKKILSVDDEEDIRESIKTILEDEGYTVSTAKNGSDCLKKIPKEKPDLIILDVLMPGLTTKEILKKIKEKKYNIPIMIVSVVKLPEKTKKEISPNMIKGYIEKPFENKDLIKAVKKILK